MANSKKRKKLEEKIIELANEKGLTLQEFRSNLDAIKHPSSFPVLDLSSHTKNNRLTIGVISDTCLNSKYTRWDILHTAYDIFKKLKVPYVLHCGNITDGYLRSQTHVNHIVYQGYDQMITHIAEEYPKIGVPTYFIGGRNERTFFKRKFFGEKTNVCLDLEDERRDLVFLGWHNAKVRIAPKVTLALSSPKSGSRKPYTVSHPIQKIIESYGGGEKPDIQIVGYYNQRWSGIHRDVYSIMIGTTQNQPPEDYSDAEPAHTLGALTIKFKFKNGIIAPNGVSEGDIPFYE